MGIDKMVGKRRDISVQGDWSSIASLVRKTQALIEELPNQKNLGGICYPELSTLVDHYTSPSLEENFKSFQERAFEHYFGNGLRKDVAALLFYQKVPLGIDARHPIDNGSLVVRSIVRPDQYHMSVFSSGVYSSIGERIAFGVKSILNEMDLAHDYRSRNR